MDWFPKPYFLNAANGNSDVFNVSEREGTNHQEANSVGLWCCVVAVEEFSPIYIAELLLVVSKQNQLI